MKNPLAPTNPARQQHRRSSGLALLLALLFGTHLVGAVDAGGLRWEPPSNADSTVTCATGTWRKAGSSWPAPRKTGPTQTTPPHDSTPATGDENWPTPQGTSTRTTRSLPPRRGYDPFEEPPAATNVALVDSHDTRPERNPLRDDRLQPIAHHEPKAIEGPHFAEATMPAPEGSPPQMRSVLVDRSHEKTESTGSPAPRVAVQPDTDWRSNRISRRQIPPDPFESEPSTPAEAPSQPETPPNSLRDGELPENDGAEEPRALDVPVDVRQPADDAREPLQDRQPELDDLRDLPSALDTRSIDLDAETGGAVDEDEYLREREKSQKDCNRYQRLLKAHTLRPWRDTQKEGWDQRPGDEIRDLLNIRAAGREGVDYPFECGFKDESYAPRSWAEITYLWKASALCHKPLYFEDVQLERYGHSWGPFAQPLVSGAHFFATIPILPYKMGLKTPNECVYTLGYYRPGSCAPYLIDPVPFTWRAALWQAGAVVGFSAIVP